MSQPKFILQLDPWVGGLEKIPYDKLMEWFFYSIDKNGCKVDTIFWETHCFIEQESPCNNMPLYEKCRREGVNIMQMIIDECHKRGIKAYLHHRFSEVDRNSSPEAKKHGLATRNGRNEIKYNHKDWVIKTWWQEGLWNLASKELQRFKLDYIKKTMSQYSFDGICIDYLRHLPCLPVGKQWEYRDCATEFMSTLRQELNELGRSIALGAKLPENGRACHEDGFDVEAWVKKGCVDFVVGGSRTINPDIAWYKSITKGSEVEVYSGWDTWHVSDAYHHQKSDFYRGMFLNRKLMGADGIVAFNFTTGPFSELKKLLSTDEIIFNVGNDYSDFYRLFSEEAPADKKAKYVAERRGGYPFLTGCGGNNVFAPLPAPIPNDETPLDIPIDIMAEYTERKVHIKLVITNAKSFCDRFKVFLNGTEIEDFAEDYYYLDNQLFWPQKQPTTYGNAYINSSPVPILAITAEVDSSLLKGGRNYLSISVIDRFNYMLDSDSIDVQRAEITVN